MPRYVIVLVSNSRIGIPGTAQRPRSLDVFLSVVEAESSPSSQAVEELLHA